MLTNKTASWVVEPKAIGTLKEYKLKLYLNSCKIKQGKIVRFDVSTLQKLEPDDIRQEEIQIVQFRHYPVVDLRVKTRENKLLKLNDIWFNTHLNSKYFPITVYLNVGPGCIYQYYMELFISVDKAKQFIPDHLEFISNGAGEFYLVDKR